jgi:glutaredoxin
LNVTLYTKAGCRLCDEAEDTLRRLGKFIQFELRIVYIDCEPALQDRFADRVPVVYIDGREVASAPIDEAALRLAISA